MTTAKFVKILDTGYGTIHIKNGDIIRDKLYPVKTYTGICNSGDLHFIDEIGDEFFYQKAVDVEYVEYDEHQNVLGYGAPKAAEKFVVIYSDQRNFRTEYSRLLNAGYSEVNAQSFTDGHVAVTQFTFEKD